jgi:hypothetical protein
MRSAQTTSRICSQLFVFGIKKGWSAENPCNSSRRLSLGGARRSDSLARSSSAHCCGPLTRTRGFGSTDRAPYLTAAMGGLRQGELLALRWRDVDWEAKQDPRSAQLRAGALGHPEVDRRLTRRAAH